MQDIDEKLILIHLTERNNGGNLALKNLANAFSKHIGHSIEELPLMKNKLKIFKYIFSQRHILLFSNPILLIFFWYKRRAVYFVQSIETKLFSPEDFNSWVVFFYKALIAVALKLSRNAKIYNSPFTEENYLHLNRSFGCYDLPNALYFKKYQAKTLPLEKNKLQCIWIGTYHKRKGFAELIELACNNKDYSFICIFSGQLPELRSVPENVRMYSNLAPGIVHKHISESEFSIITSSFESLCLPLLEGLLYDNQVVVKKSRYVFSNFFHEYVHVSDDVGRVCLDTLTPKRRYTFEDPDVRMQAFFERLSDGL